MILGVGIDIVEVDRIERSHSRFGVRFLERILCAEEIKYCLAHRKPGPHIAARFAAKEAISKAFGTGIGHELSWHDMEIVRAANGAPSVLLRGKGEALLQRLGGGKIHVSLSHTEKHATAMAILEGG